MPDRVAVVAVVAALTSVAALHPNGAAVSFHPARMAAALARPLLPCSPPRPSSLADPLGRVRTPSASSAASPASGHSEDDGGSVGGSERPLLSEYLRMIRPVTLPQAVGALAVGRLAIVAGSPPSLALTDERAFVSAAVSVYLSYGAGMVMNDCADADADAVHAYKSDRPAASGRIGRSAGRAYAAGLTASALAVAAIGVGPSFAAWIASNSGLMLAYALGLQRALPAKNAVVGWLSVSPLLGAALLGGGGAIGGGSLDAASVGRLWRLASVGFPVAVSREILKDLEDVDVDRGVKSTLPLALGEGPARAVAFGLAWLACGLLSTESYRSIFASDPPWYGAGHVVGTAMIARASVLPVKAGQRLLKKSIYVLLAGMIGGLLAQ